MLSPEKYGLLAIPEVETDALASFRCTKPRLDEFLVEGALPFHLARLGFTNVVFHEDYEGPVAYFTLSNDAIPLNESEKFDLGFDSELSLSSFPAVKIGRLAVHQQLQREGVGTAVMDLIIGEILDSSYLSAGRLLVVDADNDEHVLSFYKRLGFENSLWAADVARRNQSTRARATTIKMHRDILKAP